MEAVRRFVIAGGPGVRKSTTIEEIAKRGFPVIHEVARDLIQESQRADPEFTPRKNPYGFRKQVIDEQLRREAEATSGDVFIDVGLIENFVYAQLQLPCVPDEFGICLQRGRYDVVFLLERPEAYALDGVRHESLAEARSIDRRVRALYVALDYPVIDVPVLPSSERADFILARLPERR